jgi:hypothetical protein
VTKQFGRKYLCQIGTLVFDALDVEFRAIKTLNSEPNTLDLVVYNLTPDHRKQLKQNQNLIAKLDAGYTGNIGTVFYGRVRDVHSEYDPPDWITQLSSGDGEQEKQTARINESFAPGTPLPTILTKAAEALGLGVGNIVTQAPLAQFLDGSKQTLHGTVLSGPAARELDRIAHSAGLEWSIQDQIIQFLPLNQPTNEVAVVLTPATGLIGSPTIGNDGIISASALLNSAIIPGRQLHIYSREINVVARCESVAFMGSSAGGDWYADIEAKELEKF